MNFNKLDIENYYHHTHFWIRYFSSLRALCAPLQFSPNRPKRTRDTSSLHVDFMRTCASQDRTRGWLFWRNLRFILECYQTCRKLLQSDWVLVMSFLQSRACSEATRPPFYSSTHLPDERSRFSKTWIDWKSMDHA
jgi:hypothetical protein